VSWAEYDRARRASDVEYAERRRQRSRDWKNRNRAYNRLRDRERLRARRVAPVGASPFHTLKGDSDVR